MRRLAPTVTTPIRMTNRPSANGIQPNPRLGVPGTSGTLPSNSTTAELFFVVRGHAALVGAVGGSDASDDGVVRKMGGIRPVAG